MDAFDVDGGATAARFAGSALAGSALALAASLTLGSEIAAAVSYGAFLACLAGAALHFALGLGGAGERGTPLRWPRPLGALPDLLGRVRVNALLARETYSRLSGTLVVENRTGRPVTVAGLGVGHPTGCRVAVAAADAPPVAAITVRFDGVYDPVRFEVGAGEVVERRFHVLLPSGGTDERHVVLLLDLDGGHADGEPTRRTCRVRRRIPT